jgi:hypothetical protein
MGGSAAVVGSGMIAPGLSTSITKLSTSCSRVLHKQMEIYP